MPVSRGLIAYVMLLAVVSASLCVLLIALGYRVASPIALIALAAAAAVAERWSVRLSAKTVLTVYLLPAVFAAVVLDPLSAGAVAAASMLGDPEIRQRADPGRSPWLRWITYTATSFIVGATAGLTADAFIGASTGSIVAATFAAMAVAECLDFTFVVVTSHVRRRSMGTLAHRLAPVAVTSFLVYAPVVVALTLAYVKISAWTMLLFVVPALAFQRLYTLYRRERELSDDLRTANETLARANLSFAAALIATLDARDRYTAGHSAAVAIYSRDIANRMGLSEELQERAYLCGLVHDIGKIGLSPGLLEKPGTLTLDERRQMQQHAAIGERILRNVAGYDDVALIVRHHHERVDGEGYPDGIKGMAIPLLSRIIGVADAYNAMTSDRPYRDAMPSRVARLRLAQAVESQFDTAVVAAFEAVLASSDEAYRTATTTEFRFFDHADDSVVLHQAAPSVVLGAA